MTADDLSYQLDELDRLISEVQRQQMLANSRVRQDLMAIVTGQGIVILAIIAMWSGFEWHWWYAMIASVIMPASLAASVSAVQSREEPAWPKMDHSGDVGLTPP